MPRVSGRQSQRDACPQFCACLHRTPIMLECRWFELWEGHFGRLFPCMFHIRTRLNWGQKTGQMTLFSKYWCPKHLSLSHHKKCGNRKPAGGRDPFSYPKSCQHYVLGHRTLSFQAHVSKASSTCRLGLVSSRAVSWWAWVGLCEGVSRLLPTATFYKSGSPPVSTIWQRKSHKTAKRKKNSPSEQGGSHTTHGHPVWRPFKGFGINAVWRAHHHTGPHPIKTVQTKAPNWNGSTWKCTMWLELGF